ncbi:HEAT repeat domain-containing protein [Actinoplanes sp. NPDC049681]|uniref:HEAT repeat domain-containing protein n=1 Tax=Actinoplanes sp. NPDC049681 TaxID=3363905 RepID=UPI00378A52CD
MNRLDRDATLRWAADRLSDPSVRMRQFASELVLMMSFSRSAPDPMMAEALRPRLGAEDDPIALGQVISAFAEFTTPWDSDGPVDMSDVVPHARHRDPGIRRRVAGELDRAIGSSSRYSADPPVAPDVADDVVAALLDLAEDPDATVRAAALRTLGDSEIGLPQVHEALAAHVDDDHRDARFQAAAGLALRGDPAALAALRRMAADSGYETSEWWACDLVERRLRLRANRSAAG